MERDIRARGLTSEVLTRLAQATSKGKRARSVDRHPRTEIPESHEARRVTLDEIATRAYEIYLARGGEPGHDLDDWLQAEQELCFPAAQT